MPTRSSVLTLLTVLLCFPKNFVPSELYLWLLLTLQNLLSKQDDCQEITANCQLSKFPVACYFQRILQNPFSYLTGEYDFNVGFGCILTQIAWCEIWKLVLASQCGKLAWRTMNWKEGSNDSKCQVPTAQSNGLLNSLMIASKGLVHTVAPEVLCVGGTSPGKATPRAKSQPYLEL